MMRQAKTEGDCLSKPLSHGSRPKNAETACARAELRVR